MPKRKRSLCPVVCGVPSFTALSFSVLAVVKWREWGYTSLFASPLQHFKAHRTLQKYFGDVIVCIPRYLGRVPSRMLSHCFLHVLPRVTCPQIVMFSVIIHNDHNYHHTKHTIEQCVNLFVRTITAPTKQITMSETVTMAT